MSMRKRRCVTLARIRRALLWRWSFERDLALYEPCFEYDEEFGDVCERCGGDGCDPMADFALACPDCEGDGR